jgi:hypothetical protein
MFFPGGRGGRGREEDIIFHFFGTRKSITAGSSFPHENEKGTNE